MRNYLTVLILLLLVVGPSSITYCWVEYEIYCTRKEVKREMIKGISKDKLVLLSFTEQESGSGLLRWQHSKEFEYDGGMYDIVETSFSKDSVHYLCWPDKKESELNIQLAQLVKLGFREDERNERNQSNLLSFLRGLYFPQYSDLIAPEVVLVSAQPWRHGPEVLIKGYSSPPWSPPQSC